MMELEAVYRTDWQTGDERKRHSFRSTASSWSSINQIAFTSDASSEGSESTSRLKCVNQSFIHIVDSNKPWEIHSIDSGHADTITEVHWHPSGCYLLSVDKSGVFKLWSMKNNLVNEWNCERTVSVGEKPVCSLWLGMSAKFLFCDVPKDLGHLVAPGNTQSFPRNKMKHPLEKLSGMSRDGWVTVTETGMVYFISMNSEVPIAKLQIDTDLQGIKAGDIAFSNDGYVIIGLADGLVGSVARFYKVSFQCTSSTSVSIKCSTLQTLSPMLRNKSSNPYAITHVKFVYRNSGTHVFICNKGLLESRIERWHLTTEHQQLHELCQKQLPHKKPPSIKTWECLCTCEVRKHIACLAVPWLPVDPDKIIGPDNMQNYSYPRHNLIVGFADGHVTAMNSMDLTKIEGEFQTFQHLPSEGNKPKKLKTSFSGHSKALLSLNYSPCSCCIVGLSGDGTLYLIKCQPTRGISHIQVSMAMANLLEYCLVSGWDWWDVLVTLKHQNEEILDATLRLFEQDCKNLSHVKFLSIKAGLLSLTACSETKVRDCYSKQFLLAVGNFFKSLVPLGDDRLTDLCKQVNEIDLENLHQNFDLRDFEVDSGILKTLHPLAQWLTDCCVSLIGILLVQQGRDTMPGASLLQDNQCVLLLKQLILLVFIWAKQFPGILPNCVAPIEKLDWLMHLFKIISKLWMVNKQALEKSELQAAATELEPLFVNHLDFLYQTLVLSPSNRGVTGKQAYFKPGEPDEYKFGRPPRDRMLPLKLLTTQYSGNIDVVKKIFLGNIPEEKLRCCTKCEGVSLLVEGGNNQESIWGQRWTKSCVCGGVWKRSQK